ncbi:flap endonuclease, partial [Streptomyces sp. SID9944]|nr:flap endonuclease [Streptomyces sp. SID9944]
LPRAPRDADALRELAARWGLGGSLQRLLTTLAA